MRTTTTEALVFTVLLLEVSAVGTVPSVLLRRRGRPTAALSWLLALFALPALGVLLWWAFGRTRLERKLRPHLKSRTHLAQLRREVPVAEENYKLSVFSGFLPARARGISAFASVKNQVELLTDGKTAFDRMETEMRSARESLQLLFYTFELDETGRRFCEILKERAAAGVQVKLLVDGFGSAKTLSRLKKLLEPSGVRFEVFLRSRLYPLYAPRFNFFNHRKIIVIDHERGFCGGMNVGDSYRTDWRDLMLYVRGPAVFGLSHVLLEDWYFASQELVEDPEWYPIDGEPEASVDMAVVASGPDTEAWIHDSYFTAITHAKQRVFLATPYFIPPPSLVTALRTASGRGVDVRLVIPERSDVEWVKWASRSFYPMLTEAGVRLFEYKGPMLHAKAMIVDDELLSIGSANLDNRSLRLNFEINCFIHNRKLNEQLLKWLLEIYSDSEEITEQTLANKSISRKLLESAAHLFSPML